MAKVKQTNTVSHVTHVGNVLPLTALYTRESYATHRDLVQIASGDPEIARTARETLQVEITRDIYSFDAVSSMVLLKPDVDPETLYILAEVSVGTATRYLISGGLILKEPTVYIVGAGDVTFVPYEIRRQMELFEPGSAAAVREVGGVMVRSGFCAVLGAGGTGKTPVAHAMAQGDSQDDPETAYALIRYGEPFAGYGSDEERFAEQMLAALATRQHVVADSLKDLLSGSGAAMKSGLTRSALPMISSWAVAAANLGAVIYAPVNPSTDDADVERLLKEALRSNATSIMLKTAEDTWSYTSRAGEGMMRFEGSVTVVWDEATSAARVASNGRRRASGVMISGAIISDDDFDRAMQRALSKKF